MYYGIVENLVVPADLSAPLIQALVFTTSSVYTFPMEKIKLDEFLSYSYLSGVKAGEDGIFFTLSRAKEDRTGYSSDFYMLKDGEPRSLTSDGRAGWGTTWKKKLYFTAKRTEEETKDDEKSTIYALPLDGGEASPWLTVDGKLTKYEFISDDTLVALFSVDKRFEGLDEDERKKRKKEAEGYEEIEESPFYLNGEGFTCGRRTRLAVIRKGVTSILFDDDYDTSSYTLSPDRTKLLCTGNVRKGAKPSFTSEVRCVSLSDLGWETVLPEGELSIKKVWFLSGKIIAAGSDRKKYGINQNPDFYTLENGKAVLLSPWGDSLWSSVGTDIRFKGGESSAVDGEWIYFTSTKGHSSFVYRINAEGVTEPVITEEGSVDSVSVYNGDVYYIGLREQRLQELYRGSEKLTAFNDDVLKGKYVAVPEEIEYENDGIELKGWVIKPFGWESGRTYPAILDIHGGPKTVYGTVFMHEMQYWANEGFFVFWTNPRGSDGRGDDFADIRGKYGSIDYSDLMAFTSVVMEKYPSINRERVAVTGGSYGGFMSNWILGHTSFFKAIATQRSIYNWISFYGSSDIGSYFATDQCGCTWDDTLSLYHRSPMEAIRKNASTPTLILHSDKDYRCPVEQAYQLYTTLVDMGVETRFILFHDENHELSRSGKPVNRIKRLDEITKWFRKFLL